MMTLLRSLTLSALIVAAAGCGGENWLDPVPNPNNNICQLGSDKCCTDAERICRGDPDGKMVCTCYKDWDCDSALSPQKCSQTPADVPDGKTGWKCVVQGGKDVCTRSGTDLPSGVNRWTCSQQAGNITCERPLNTPDGGSAWGCMYSGDQKFCSKLKTGQDLGVPKLDTGVPPPPPPPPKGDLGTQPKPDQTVTTGWTCFKDAQGNNICTKPGAGLPPGGGSWKCYWKNGSITCEGSSPIAPGGSGWSCVPNDLVGGWRCTKPINDLPPGSGTWSCTSSTGQGGASCYQPPPKGGGQVCIPGQKMWCDGHVYCGYGQVVCGPDGQWKKRADGELDCTELANGGRPNTVCACYFFYFNKDCCETPNCLVPPNSTPQICPASKGAYCDYCNPQKPECVAPGAKCVVTSKAETFCAQDCTGGKPCPTGAICTQVESNNIKFWQCVPLDQSCYY